MLMKEGRGVRVRELGFMQAGHLISLNEPDNQDVLAACRDELPTTLNCIG